MTRDEIETLLARERPGWQVMDVLEVSDESGPSFEVVLERGSQRRRLVVDGSGRILGEDG